MHHRDTSDPIAWAKRVNRGWFVRGGLNDSTDAWLTYLEQTDPVRLLASCDIARALSRGPDRTVDPKPWFYAGLFSLASPEEARHHLTNHRFTAAAIPALVQDESVKEFAAALGCASHELLTRVRHEVQTQIASRATGNPA